MTEDLSFRIIIRLTKITVLMTKVHYQVSQSNWLDSKGFGKKLSKTLDKRIDKDLPLVYYQN